MRRNFFVYLAVVVWLLTGCVAVLPEDPAALAAKLSEAVATMEDTEGTITPTQADQACPIDAITLVMADEMVVGEETIVRVDTATLADPTVDIQFIWSTELGEFQAGQITTGPSNIYLPRQEGADLIAVNMFVSKDGAEIVACRTVEARKALLLSASSATAGTESPSITTGDFTGVLVGRDVTGVISSTINEAQKFREKYTVEGETPDSIILLVKDPQANPLTGVFDLFGGIQNDNGITNPNGLIDAINDINLTVAGDGFIIASGTEVEVLGEPQEILMETAAFDNVPPLLKESLGPFLAGLTMTPVRVLEGQYAGEEGWVISNLIRRTEVPLTEEDEQE